MHELKSGLHPCTLRVGATLSEPHTSKTALCTCMCMLACLLASLQPHTVNFKWARSNLNINKIELVHPESWCRRAKDTNSHRRYRKSTQSSLRSLTKAISRDAQERNNDHSYQKWKVCHSKCIIVQKGELGILSEGRER